MLYYRYYKEHVYKWAQYLSNIALVMYAIENTSLVTLSFWTSDENYGMQTHVSENLHMNIKCVMWLTSYIVFLTAFHKMSFITFLMTSFIHMFLAHYIMKSCLNIAKGSNDASLRWKRKSMMLNVLSILMACYFFYRHNRYCEPLGRILIDFHIIIHSYFSYCYLRKPLYFSVFNVCLERIRSCALKHGISSNCCVGFCYYTSYDNRKQT